MTTSLPRLTLLCSTTLLLAACPGDDASSDGTESSADSGTGADDSTGGECTPSDEQIPALDESACAPSSTDYTPTVNMSADDMWPACANDDGTYHPFEAPSSAARTEAFEMIRTIFANGLTPDDFTAAREQYSLEQGLESRCVRREDVHYPNIPDAEQDPTVDFDKQCTIEALVAAYPDRCAGPAKIAPVINDAFAAGQSGEGDPAVHAARIMGAIEWFLYLSVIKEATFSCPPADFSGDCDAAWGYYSGATDRGSPLGYGADVIALSPQTNERVFDGLAAMRCFRDGYPSDMDADTSDPLYVAGRDQLDRANNHAAAIVLRDRMGQQLPLCGSEADANWAWVQTFGQGLIKPAEDTDATQAGVLTSLLANDAPTPEDIQAGVTAIDALFPCP
ncbi:MAG: hypothetical protein H6712_13375 [Myxococcales bacterium]|nr:hypothetical protein [Myxococcales bacterium]MCB9714852.1 hypothetical protein [Myxococcales bacterium]